MAVVSLVEAERNLQVANRSQSLRHYLRKVKVCGDHFAHSVRKHLDVLRGECCASRYRHYVVWDKSVM
jgi:hypothetical protein